ncbi:MAG: cysteine desulfurase family protein [Hyphomicrobiales bacterium]
MIYFDHAATTPLHPAARRAMDPFLNGDYGNPSGLYALGRAAQAALDDARNRVAACLGSRPSEIIFTSGGTESINSALIGIAYAMRRAGAGNHIVTTAIEHHAALHAAQFLEELGFDVTYVGCDPHGRVRVEDVEAALRPETVLASVMLANNEVGTIQPIAEISALLRDYAKRHHHVLLHTDAVQAPGWLDLDVEVLGVDALSLSSHKFGGPKGSGVLYLRRATPFRQLLHGGGQEMQKRAGTEHVAGVVGTAVALEIAQAGTAERSARVRALRDRLREGILASNAGVSVNGCHDDCLPNNLNLSFDGVESDVLVAALDAAGVAASSGSACSNSTWEPSHVLMAMGVPIRRAVGSVRFSLGESTTEAEVDHVIQLLPGLVAQARRESVAAGRLARLT